VAEQFAAFLFFDFVKNDGKMEGSRKSIVIPAPRLRVVTRRAKSRNPAGGLVVSGFRIKCGMTYR